MSFRELRNFTEMMRALGYPRLISIENFRTPNFELVADCLHWLIMRYDSKQDLGDVITTEEDRIAFLKKAAEIMLTKARIKLNLKSLYSANGFAVKELLKIATCLYDAYKNAADEEEEDTANDFGPSHKFSDIKLTRTLASDITKYGAKLYELLETHPESAEMQQRALARNYDIDDIQRGMHQTVEQVQEQIVGMDKMLENLKKDEANLQVKMDKKKTELDRHTKRLQSLVSVRPAFMDDYEKMETELQKHYEVYLQNWRNLQFLESELDTINTAEQERIEENNRQLKLMQRRLREEELRILRGQTKVDEQALDAALLNNAHGERSGNRQANGGGSGRPMKRPGAASIRRDRGEGGGQDIYGSMNPEGEESEEDSEEDSGRSEDETGSDSDDGEVSLQGDPGRKAGGSGSDDDLIDDDDNDEDEGSGSGSEGEGSEEESEDDGEGDGDNEF